MKHAVHDSGIVAETAMAQAAAPKVEARLARAGPTFWVRVLLQATS